MARPQLRPLGVGETLDATFSIYRARFSTFVTIVAIVLVPIGILTTIINVTATNDADPATIASAFSLPLLIVSILGWVAQLLATGGVVKAVAAEYLGESITWQEALDAARQRIGALMLASVLIAIGVAIGFILFIIPGLILLVSWALTIPAIVVEDLRAAEGIGRSWSLVGGRRWSIFGVFVILYIIIIVVQLIIAVGLAGLLIADSGDASVLASNLLSLATQVFTVPLLAIAITVVYFDQRVRKEGFDLELLAQQVGGTVHRPDPDPGIASDPGTLPPAPPPASDTNPPPEAGDGWPPAGS